MYYTHTHTQSLINVSSRVCVLDPFQILKLICFGGQIYSYTCISLYLKQILRII